MGQGVVVSYLGSVVHHRGEVVGAGLRSGVLAVELSHVLTHIVPGDVQVRVSVEPETRFTEVVWFNLDRMRSKRQKPLMNGTVSDLTHG